MAGCSFLAATGKTRLASRWANPRSARNAPIWYRSFPFLARIEPITRPPPSAQRAEATQRPIGSLSARITLTTTLPAFQFAKKFNLINKNLSKTTNYLMSLEGCAGCAKAAALRRIVDSLYDNDLLVVHFVAFCSCSTVHLSMSSSNIGHVSPTFSKACWIVT